MQPATRLQRCLAQEEGVVPTAPLMSALKAVSVAEATLAVAMAKASSTLVTTAMVVARCTAL